MAEAVNEIPKLVSMSDVDLLKGAGVEMFSWEEVLSDEVDDLDVDGRIVDNGIGPYEYWGCRGFHSQLDFEAEGSGDLTLKWNDTELPDLDELSSFTKEKKVWVGKEGAEEDYTVDLSFGLTEFSVEAKHEKIGGKKVWYWECKATFCWEVAS